MHIEFVVTKRCCVYRRRRFKRKMYNLERMYKEAKYVRRSQKSLFIQGYQAWLVGLVDKSSNPNVTPGRCKNKRRDES